MFKGVEYVWMNGVCYIFLSSKVKFWGLEELNEMVLVRVFRVSCCNVEMGI